MRYSEFVQLHTCSYHFKRHLPLGYATDVAVRWVADSRKIVNLWDRQRHLLTPRKSCSNKLQIDVTLGFNNFLQKKQVVLKLYLPKITESLSYKTMIGLDKR